MIETESVPCGLCGETDSRPFNRLREWSLVQCRACNGVFLNPRPTRAALTRLYSQEYFTEKRLQHDHRASVVKAEVALRADPVAQLTAEAGHVGRWLDIGCASGYLLAAARRAGWHVQGVEISEWAAQFASVELGLTVFCGTLEGFAEDDHVGEFDLVTAMAYLEHSPSPPEDIRLIRRMLLPGGVVAIRVPNLGSFDRLWHGDRWRGWDPPFHLFHFTVRRLRELLEEEGLAVYRVHREFWNPLVHIREWRLGEGLRADHPYEGRDRLQSTMSLGRGRSAGARGLKSGVRALLGPILTGRDMVLYARKT